jgi:hypothetical protein
VWLNPPYGTSTARWLARMAEHGNGIVLIYARVETRMFFDYIWDRADGAENVAILKECGIEGKLITLNNEKT